MAEKLASFENNPDFNGCASPTVRTFKLFTRSLWTLWERANDSGVAIGSRD